MLHSSESCSSRLGFEYFNLILLFSDNFNTPTILKDQIIVVSISPQYGATPTCARVMSIA